MCFYMHYVSTLRLSSLILLKKKYVGKGDLKDVSPKISTTSIIKKKFNKEFLIFGSAMATKYVLPPRQIKSTVRLCRRIKNRRRQIQTFDLNNN